ncbi:DNA-binding response OmpR family regulator [Paenibacillus sp. DS2015]|uniref:response regulator transcription factor n=1 Tax=Paenibacillus sp. DS2015 TaxID=3373917 RepID=UPI003D1DADCF
MSKIVLLVEDERRIREIVADYFKQQQWIVYEADNGKRALEMFEITKPNLIILDILMPGMDGFSVCRQIRNQSDVPIILLTAKSDDDDKIHGFELGADDYVTKPFSPKVLVVRANTLMRRLEGKVSPQGHNLRFGQAVLNTLAHRLNIEDIEIELTPKEYELLQFMIQNKGIVLSRDTILDRVWGADFEGDSRVVDTHIKKLRSKLGHESRYIRTVIGTGYRFEVEE